MPAVGLVGALVVIMIGDERAGRLGFFCNRFRSSISRATPIASANVWGYLIFTSMRTSSRRPATKHPMRKLSGRPSTWCDSLS